MEPCAVNPYLAHSTIKELIDQNLLDKDYYAAVDDYDSAVLHGIVKITLKWVFSQSSHIRVQDF